MNKINETNIKLTLSAFGLFIWLNVYEPCGLSYKHNNKLTGSRAPEQQRDIA